MGKIASKYCKLCEANNEIGNANLKTNMNDNRS